MNFPFESVVTTAIEQISAGVQLKISQNEEKRNREFLYDMKELEFYKSSYDKDLRGIFDYWFDLVRLVHIKDNEYLSQDERNRLKKEFDKKIRVETISKYQFDTLKYGGKMTCKVLALRNRLAQKNCTNKPGYADLYIWCKILSVLKKDVLGQDLEAEDILKVLLNDYDENESEIMESKKYIENLLEKNI